LFIDVLAEIEETGREAMAPVRRLDYDPARTGADRL
jgi:hypothetical protein